MKSESNIILKMRNDAASIFNKGLQAVEAGSAVKRYCKLEKDNLFVGGIIYDLSRFENIFVVGAGKATASMAAALENILGKRITGGAINVKYKHTARLSRIKLIEAGHPVPDENGEKGVRAILGILENAGKDDLVLCLISGGGSALLPSPVQGITLKDKQDTIRTLLSCGADINEINAIRKHISTIKGGGLSRAAYPAVVVALILSDVVGDNLDTIASGPTAPDLSTFPDCMEIINKYNILKKIPKSVINHIKAGLLKKIPETPDAAASVFDKTFNLVIGSNIEAIIAAKQKAESLGYNTFILSSMVEGDTTQVAHIHYAIAKEIIKTGNPVPPPACVLSGGETTVTVTGNGLGGRNQEFSLVAATDIAGMKNIVVLSGGTDGTDGPTDAAGAISDSGTLERAGVMGLDPYHFLANNDSYHFFKKLNDLLMTGPTNTNVMDLRVMLVIRNLQNE